MAEETKYSETYSFLRLKELIHAKQERRKDLLAEIVRLDTELEEAFGMLSSIRAIRYNNDKVSIELLNRTDIAIPYEGKPVVTMETWLPLTEAAHMLGVSYPTMVDWRLLNKIKWEKRGRGYWVDIHTAPKKFNRKKKEE